MSDKMRGIVENWDLHIERRGGGYTVTGGHASQYFVVTNMSSLLAMLAEVVFEF